MDQLLDIKFLRTLTPYEFSKILGDKKIKEDLAYRLIRNIEIERKEQRKKMMQETQNRKYVYA